MDITQREEKIKSKRMKTTKKDFIKEICSRFPLVFYKNHGIISKFPENDRIENIKKTIEFEQTRDALTEIGHEYNLNQSFFTQYSGLFKHIGLGSVFDFGGNTNSEFAECVQSSKNAYLSFVTILGCENVFYSFSVKDNSINIFNSVMVLGASNNIYYSTGIKTGYNIYFSKYIYDSSNIRFSTNMQNCQECLFCNNLENKSYCINNEQLEKEEYLKQKTEFLKEKTQFPTWNNKISSVIGKNIACTNSEGTLLFNCENVENGHMSSNVINGRNVIMALSKENNENYGDIFCAGRSTDMYGGIVTGTFSNKVYNSMMISNSSNIFYSYGLNDCSYCIGCIGLKNKKFCILNKQYSKEDRNKLADKIFAQMEKDGNLGDFFPGSMNPFYFNDTAAYLIDDSFTKDEIEADGHLRREKEIKVDIPEGSESILSSELDQYQGRKIGDKFYPLSEIGNKKLKKGIDAKRTIDDSILKKIIIDEKGNYYRIVKMEYDFLIKHGLPLPEIHWLDRIKLGFKFNV